jgi:hypothetical protein
MGNILNKETTTTGFPFKSQQNHTPDAGGENRKRSLAITAAGKPIPTKQGLDLPAFLL